MIIILMGVSGSGKTTVGKLLARELDWPFADADQFHPAANLDRMRRGTPLTDQDRLPWLHALTRAIDDWLREDRNVVLSCSALKAEYRRLLLLDPERMVLVYLKGDPELIAERVASREGHFASLSLLPSQFEALEEPTDGLVVNVQAKPEELARRIREQLKI